MVIYTIYKATNKINGKCYIGFDSNWPKRQSEHKSSSKVKDYKFYKAIRKYGWDNFEWSVIYQSKDKEHTLKVMENYFIIESDSLRMGYNMTLGGEGNHGRILTESMVENYRQSKLGEKNPNFGGKSWTKEARDKLSKTQTGKKLPKLVEWHKNNICFGKTKVTCPYCQKSGASIVMQRWHFEKCKFKI